MTHTPAQSRTPRWLSWGVTAAILALAALLRLWALGRPDSLVFDELYYVRDAISQLTHGYPTDWPDDDPAFDGERAAAFTDTATTIAHPPLGKWLIGLGILLFGADSGWGWRISVALAGIATAGITMGLAQVLTRNHWVAWIAGFLLAIDGVHIVMSRVSLLDGLLTCLVALGALCVALDWQRSKPTSRICWRRPWLLAAGVVFGAAAAVKWSGLYALAGFLLLLTLADLVRRLRDKDRRALLHGAAQGLVTAAIALPAAFAAYLVSWIGWIVMPGGDGWVQGQAWWVSLWNWHTNSLAWHGSLDAPHPYQAHPLTWPFALRPTSMYRASEADTIAAITALPNPLVTWLGVLALGLLAWVLLRSLIVALRSRAFEPVAHQTVWVCAFVVTGYLSGWLPWLATFSRSAVFQFYSVVMTPFAALALALALASLAALTDKGKLLARAGIVLDGSAAAVLGRRMAVVLVLAGALVLTVLFWPLWSAMPTPEWFYQWHRWLPGW